MRRAVWFLVVLLAGLGLLALAGYFVLAQTTGAWFERDLELRTRLAVAAGRRSILGAWKDQRELIAVLEDITRDERILGGAACSPTGELMAETSKFPADLSTKTIIRSTEDNGSASTEPRPMIRDLEHGRVHVSAPIPIRDDAEQLKGFVILVHDLTFVARRES